MERLWKDKEKQNLHNCMKNILDMKEQNNVHTQWMTQPFLFASQEMQTRLWSTFLKIIMKSLQ